MVVIKEPEPAKAHGVPIYALVCYGTDSGGYDMLASGVGSERCMELAMAEADQRTEKAAKYINTHKSSTAVDDLAELGAIKRLFDRKGHQPHVGSTKSLSGHALGAAGVHETIDILLMLNNNFMAKSANIQKLVDKAEGMHILTEKKDGAFTQAMSISRQN